MGCCCWYAIIRAEMMKQSPTLMTSALKKQHDILRKCKYTNIGYTIEQEGDSYSYVFHEAFDAVAFCLQVGGPCQAGLPPSRPPS